MECDTDHSIIEKKKKKFDIPISHPHDWAQLMRQFGRKKPMVVIGQRCEDLSDFAGPYKGPLQLRKEDSDGNKIRWREIKWLHFERDHGFDIFFKTSLKEEDPFRKVSFRRRGKSTPLLRPTLRYDGLQPIAIQKKKDLLDLLPFIDPVFPEYYKSLKTNTNVRDIYPDSAEQEEDNAGDNE
ncbi:hypothetical protein L9F63_002081 [Diploptera punctata]|uniref:Uncharacterized protein n=1 Tax=Diploptera punctata TaxID=6984 RepID=A0AAD8A3M0_DIPPU|nr:hypothetical protein L9F63_002081 [Diploptera punctata]